MPISHGLTVPTISTDFLRKLGRPILENAYALIPIPAGQKSPGFEGWQNTKATPTAVREWSSTMAPETGIGILTKNTPAIDLDILDDDVVKQMQDWCLFNIGDAPIRIGRAPKRLLIYRCDEPFSKMKTGKYADEWGDTHEIEILGNGQQFVAYGIHKDTQRTYEWTTTATPVTTHAQELVTLTVEDCHALMAHFVKRVTAMGWKRVTSPIAGAVKNHSSEADCFADVETKVDIEPEELKNKLMSIPGAEDHDRWVQVGMALSHQFDGTDDGKQLWHDWSELADNYDADELDKRWTSFAIEGKGRAPLTARTLLKWASEAVANEAHTLLINLKDSFVAAKDDAEWRQICTKVKHAEIDALARASLIEIARKKHFELTGTKVPIVEVRKLMAYEISTKTGFPKWAKDWVFDGSDDKFFHLGTKITMSLLGFNTTYARDALTRQDMLNGETTPGSTCADLAMNRYKIPRVFGRLYLPGEESTFMHHGLKVANLYSEHDVPDVPATLRPSDKAAIARVRNHIAHLLEDAREQRLFLDWLASVVQNPGKRVNWAMLLQGVEGDGKTFFALMLRAVMGMSNVRTLNASVLEGDFTGWAHGQCVMVIEEPRLQGHRKFEVLNKIKEYITNQIISIHAKGKDPVSIENTTNYFLCTNFRDALPLNLNDRRYCVLFSKWQTREALRDFVKVHPDYYLSLYNTITEHAPALRKWLTGHEVSDDFPMGGDAPLTRAHGYMVDAATPEFIKAIDELIDESAYPDINRHFISINGLQDALIGRDIEFPPPATMHKLLESNGYTLIGRIVIKGHKGSQRTRIWSKHPQALGVGTFETTRNVNRLFNELSRLQEL